MNVEEKEKDCAYFCIYRYFLIIGRRKKENIKKNAFNKSVFLFFHNVNIVYFIANSFDFHFFVRNLLRKLLNPKLTSITKNGSLKPPKNQLFLFIIFNLHFWSLYKKKKTLKSKSIHKIAITQNV